MTGLGRYAAADVEISRSIPGRGGPRPARPARCSNVQGTRVQSKRPRSRCGHTAGLELSALAHVVVEVVGQQRPDEVHKVPGDAFKNTVQVGFRAEAVELDRAGQGGDDCRGIQARIRAGPCGPQRKSRHPLSWPAWVGRLPKTRPTVNAQKGPEKGAPQHGASGTCSRTPPHGSARRPLFAPFAPAPQSLCFNSALLPLRTNLCPCVLDAAEALRLFVRRPANRKGRGPVKAKLSDLARFRGGHRAPVNSNVIDDAHLC